MPEFNPGLFKSLLLANLTINLKNGAEIELDMTGHSVIDRQLSPALHTYRACKDAGQPASAVASVMAIYITAKED